MDMQDPKVMHALVKWSNIRALERLELLVEQQPGGTAEALLASFRRLAEEEAARPVERRASRPCKKCGRPVVVELGSNRLIHLAPDDSTSMVGCRSTSFDWLNEQWDDNLPHTWKAT